jgi:hypothetical protein
MSQSSETGRRPRRRWYQYSLRMLLGLMTLAVGVLVGWRAYVEPYARQRQTMILIERLGGTYQTAEAPKWLRRLYGDDFQNVTVVSLTDCDHPDQYIEAISALPAVETLAVGGLEFTDAHLERLAGLSALRGLLLDSTSVSDEAIAVCRRRLSRAEVHLSQRRALEALRRTGACEILVNQDRQPVMPTSLSRVVSPDLLEEATHLVAFGPRLDDEALAHVACLRSLRLLKLDFTRVGDEGLARVRELTQLEMLYLYGTRVTDAGLKHVAQLRALRRLDLGGTRVSDEGLVHLRGLSELEELALARARLSDAGLAHLESLRLRRLELVRTAVTAEGVARLKEALPWCEIVGP